MKDLLASLLYAAVVFIVAFALGLFALDFLTHDLIGG